MKRIIEILSILLIMVTAPGCINDEVEPVWSLQTGDRLPDFEITLDDGSSVSTEMLKGRKSVIVFSVPAAEIVGANCLSCRIIMMSVRRGIPIAFSYAYRVRKERHL